MAQPIRVLVVDDSAFMRTAVSGMLKKASDIEVAGTARNGVEAVAKAKALQPDVVTLDIEMPEMDGLTALPQIKRVSKAAVIMLSSLTREGSEAALAAMRRGAEDVLAKDNSQVSVNIGDIERDLLEKVRVFGRRSQQKKHTAATHDTRVPRHLAKLDLSDYDALAIGSSTGGPPVVERLICSLPSDFPLPVLLAQHMPEMFTRAMSERLDGLSALRVRHAQPGVPVKRGEAYIAPGGKHLRLRHLNGRNLRLEVSEKPTEALYKPSVNELFASAADAFGERTLAIMLTGMGDDGLIGSRELHAKGGTLLAQDEASCVVYGMPKAVTEAGIVAASLNPDQMIQLLNPSAVSACK